MAARALAGAPLGVRRPQGVLEVVPGPRLRFHTPSPPVAPAFFTWSLRIEGRHSPGRTFSRQVPLAGTQTTLALDLPRGRYEVTARWELTDVFGFSRRVPSRRWTARITVPALPSAFTPPPPPATRTGSWHPRRTGRRSGDPFDVRRYTPGDDLRRLHWALYAHSGVPFVRTADPSPPPAGHQFLVLDSDTGSDEDLDARLSGLAAWLSDLDRRGTRWTLAVPAADRVFHPGDAVGTELAGLLPGPLPDGPVDPRWPEDVSVLTGPGSPGAARLARRLAQSRRRFHPVEVPPPPAPGVQARPWWRRPE